MKKRLFIFMGMLCAVVFVLPLSVQADEAKGMMNGDGHAKGMMMGDGAMMGGHDMMMKHGMGGPSLVATSDGGVVVLSGCTLTKYDKNLKEVKEVQLKCGMMKKGCPMMGGGKKGMGMMDDDDDDDDADHTSHH